MLSKQQHQEILDIVQAACPVPWKLPTIETSWVVLTGAPCSGKTTTLQLLAQAGLRTHSELAREMFERLDARGHRAEVVANALGDFIEDIITAKQIERAVLLHPETLHVFDRGICDSAAYLDALGRPWEHLMPLCTRFLYRKVILMERLPIDNDAFRWQSDEFRERWENSLERVYRACGNEVVKISPIGNAKERFDLIQRILTAAS